MDAKPVGNALKSKTALSSSLEFLALTLKLFSQRFYLLMEIVN